MSDLKEALADCVCYYFESEGKRVLSLAVRMWPTRAYIVGAVGEAGENWVNQSQKQIAELCAAKYVYFETKRKSIAKNFIAMGWELRYGSKIKFYKLGRAL